LIALAGVAVVSTRVWSQDEDQDKPKKKGGHAMGGMMDPAKMAEMMKKCEAAGKPGENHKIPPNTSWATGIPSARWMDGPPSAPPMDSKGKSKCKWVLDGRFIMDEYEGEMVMRTRRGK